MRQARVNFGFCFTLQATCTVAVSFKHTAVCIYSAGAGLLKPPSYSLSLQLQLTWHRVQYVSYDDLVSSKRPSLVLSDTTLESTGKEVTEQHQNISCGAINSYRDPQRVQKARQHVVQVELSHIRFPQSVCSKSIPRWLILTDKCSLNLSCRGVENLLPFIATKILAEVSCKVDMACLLLISKTMAMRAGPFANHSGLCCPNDRRTYITLMSRFESWMPQRLLFCHHCLLYRPRANFQTYINSVIA